MARHAPNIQEVDGEMVMQVLAEPIFYLDWDFLMIVVFGRPQSAEVGTCFPDTFFREHI